MNKKQVSTLIIVLAVVVIGVVIFALSTKQPESPTNEPGVRNGGNSPISMPRSKNEDNRAGPQMITSGIDTSDWKTYRNEEFGVEFRYPVDWAVPEDSDSIYGGDFMINFGPLESLTNEPIRPYSLMVYRDKNNVKYVLAPDKCGVLTENEVCIWFDVTWPFNTSIKDDFNEIANLKDKYIKDFEVGGLKAYSNIRGAGSPQDNTFIQGTKNGYRFVGFILGEENHQIFKKVVDSFKEIKN